MLLAAHLYQFWYPHAFAFFMRLWRNSLLMLEEDLAVGLMWRLLFIPLFHDASITGRIVSFFFRSTRIIVGLFAYFFATLLIFTAALVWFLAPLLVVLPLTVVLGIANVPYPLIYFAIEAISVLILGVGVIIYAVHLINKPIKKIAQLKDVTDIWNGTHLTNQQINFDYLIKTPEVQEYLLMLEIEPQVLTRIDISPTDPLINKALELGKLMRASYITPDLFFVAGWLLSSSKNQDLMKLSLKEQDILDALLFIELKRNHYRKVNIWDEDFAIKHLKGVNRGWMSAVTPMLDLVSNDLTKKAAKEDVEDFIGRGAVVHEVISILSQSEDRNVLLVGSPGVGKSTMVQHLAKMIIAGDAPEALATKRLVELDLNRLTSGITVQGELAQRLEQVFMEVEYCADIILFIDEIHNLGIGDVGNNFNLYGLISPFLESGKFQFIGSTEENNYATIIQKNGSFARLFHKIIVPPAPILDTLETIEMRAIELWYKKGIASTYLGLKELVHYADKLVHDRVLPDSAISIFKECEPKAATTKLINKELVKKTIEARVSVPIVELDDSHKQLLLNLEGEIHKRMIDQEEAVKSVADTLRRASASLRDQNRPIGSFLFVGPTGVGKTELAKSLAELYFKDKSAFVRFDMSEYQTPEAVDRLIGTENHPGELTETIKNRPYCLLLLDEFEKANPSLLNLFLQVLDDGRLTDYGGSHVDFTNTIIIATSNAASLQIAHGIGEGLPSLKLETMVKDELLKILKPELVNRFDRIVIFKPLSEENLAKIVYFKLKDVTKMLEEQGYNVTFDDAVIADIAKKGYDPVLGARPMKRVIQDTLESKLSKMILNNELKKGEVTHISMDFLN
jgi:ATP-dependent Clp protease ATP-binding subunit ClpC